MRTITLYRFERENGKTTISPDYPQDKPFTILYRLIADEGMELVKGDLIVPCIDTTDTSGWTERVVEEELC